MAFTRISLQQRKEIDNNSLFSLHSSQPQQYEGSSSSTYLLFFPSSLMFTASHTHFPSFLPFLDRGNYFNEHSCDAISLGKFRCDFSFRNLSFDFCRENEGKTIKITVTIAIAVSSRNSSSSSLLPHPQL